MRAGFQKEQEFKKDCRSELTQENGHTRHLFSNSLLKKDKSSKFQSTTLAQTEISEGLEIKTVKVNEGFALAERVNETEE